MSAFSLSIRVVANKSYNLLISSRETREVMYSCPLVRRVVRSDDKWPWRPGRAGQDSNMIIFSTKLRHSGYTTIWGLPYPKSKKRTDTRPVFVEKWSHSRTLADHNAGYWVEINERLFPIIQSSILALSVSDWIFFSAGQNYISAELKLLNISMLLNWNRW